MGFWAGMVCFGKMVGAAMSSGKSAPTPVAAPAAASSSGAELTEDNCDTFFNVSNIMRLRQVLLREKQ